MIEVKYIKGDATRPQGDGTKIIVHICNDVGGWGKGFVVALSKRWKLPEEKYRSWFRKEERVPFELGQVQLVEVESNLWVANLIGQKGIRYHSNQPPIRYEAVIKGLRKVSEYAREKNASIHMPRIGTGLAGGKWDEIERIINETLIQDRINVYVYDL